MAKVEAGRLEQMIQEMPSLRANMASAQSIGVVNAEDFGEFVTIAIGGRRFGSPELLIRRDTLLAFCQDTIQKLSPVDTSAPVLPQPDNRTT